MYKILRRESLKCVLPRLIICAVLAVALIGVSISSVVRMALGPNQLSNLSVDSLDGEYVSFDASEIVVAFATLSLTDSDSNTTVLKTYYLLPVGDGYYMAVMDKKESNSTVLDLAMEQSEEYYLGDLETLTKLGNLSGTITELDSSMVSYMTDVIDTYELPGYEEGVDSTGIIVTYQINLDYIGMLKGDIAIGLFLAGLIFLVLIGLQLAIVFTGYYQKQVRQVIGGDVDKEDFLNAIVIERIRVGKFIWYRKGACSRAIRTENLIWGFPMSEPMVVSKYRWPVALYDKNQQVTTLQFMEQSHCKDFLEAIADQGNPFIVNYTSQLAALFQDDFPVFCKEAEKAAQERTVSKETRNEVSQLTSESEES